MGLIHRILRCRRGTAAIEAALVFPVLVILLLGMVELTEYVEGNRKVMSAAQTVADLVTQDASHDDASMLDIRTAATKIMDPLNTDANNLTLVIASIGFDDGGNLRILWEYRSGSGSLTIDPAVADGLSDANESVIVVALRFAYDSPFDFLIGNRTLNEMAMARPRIARRIALNGSTDH